jgi:hypothetical protein
LLNTLNLTALRALNNGSAARLARFQFYGGLDDAETAINLLRQALSCAKALGLPSGSVPVNLGSAINLRYHAFGLRQDLDESIALFRASIGESQVPEKAQQIARSNLIGALSDRFNMTEQEVDLDEAWDLVQQELQITPSGSRLYATLCQNLGCIFQARYRTHRRPEDLAGAISALTECLNNNSYTRGDRLVDLAKTLLLRAKDFQRTTEDLDKVISLLLEALGLRQPGHPRRHEVLNTLSEAHAHRFEHTGMPVDLEEAFKIQTASVDDLPLGHTYRAQALFGLARLHLIQETSAFDVKRALDLSIEAVRENSGAAQLCLVSALEVLSSLETAAQHSSFHIIERTQLLEFYQCVIALVPRVAFFGLDLESRLRVLGKADNIASAAASHALLLDQPEIAIEALEHGRGVFWTQALRLRAPVDGLPKELEDQLNDTARQLESRARRTKADPLAEVKAAMEKEALALRQLSDRFETLITTVRKIPGHEHFLLPEEYSKLSTVADCGTVVILLSPLGHGRCVAIVLRGSRPQIIPLPNAVPEELDKFNMVTCSVHQGHRQGTVNLDHYFGDTETERLGITSRIGTSSDEITEMLGELWSKVMWPVIQALNLSVSFLFEFLVTFKL